MFKKTLVALALAGLSTSALAVEMSATGQTVSTEGFAAGLLTAGKVQATAVTAVLGAEYTAGDTIEFTITGGTFSDSVYKLVSTGATGAGDPEVVTWGLLNSTDSKLTFRATSITSAGTGLTAGRTYSLEGATGAELGVKVTSVSKDSTVVVASEAKTSTGIAIDVADDSSTTANEDAATLLTGANEFTTKVNKVNAQVDVGDDRLSFVSGKLPDFTIDYSKAAADVAPVTLVSTDVTIAGDFTGVASIIELGTDGNLAGGDDVTLTIAEDKKSAKMTLTSATPRNLKFAYTLPAAAADKVALVAPQDFTATLLAKYDVNSTIVNGEVASAWTLNGASPEIDFMPFSSEYAQSITVTNEGNVEGAISVDFIADGESTTKALTAVAAAKSVTNISAEIKALAAEIGITGNAKLRIVVNSPNDDITVSGVYYHKADGDRVKTN